MTITTKKLRFLSRRLNPTGADILHLYSAETGKDHYVLVSDLLTGESYETWQEDVSYDTGERVTFGFKLWESLQDDNEGNIPTEGVWWKEVSESAKPDHLEKTISKTAHGFVVKNILTLDGAGELIKISDPAGDKFIGIVSEVIDADNFKLIISGYVNGLSGLTDGYIHYAQSDGTLSVTPSEMPVLLADSTSSGYLLAGGGDVNNISEVLDAGNDANGQDIIDLGNLTLRSGKVIDVEASGGSDVLNIGTSNADIINIGYSGSTVNIQGTLAYQNVTNYQVKDKLITLNKGGAGASAVSSGIELEEGGVITGYWSTNGTRDGWDLKAPAISGVATISLSGLTGNRTYTLQDSNGTLYQTGGADIAVADGGTNISSYAVGDLIYASGTTTLSKLADVAVGSVLISGGVGVAPAWSGATLSLNPTTVTFGSATTFNITGSNAQLVMSGTSTQIRVQSWRGANTSVAQTISTGDSSTGINISHFSGSNHLNTSGTNIRIFTNHGFAPTSGTAAYVHFLVSDVINQTGGANGQITVWRTGTTITAAVNVTGFDHDLITPANISGQNIAFRSTKGSLLINHTTLSTNTTAFQMRGYGNTTGELMKIGDSGGVDRWLMLDNGAFTSTSTAVVKFIHDNLVTTSTEGHGIWLANTTAATSVVPAQYGLSITWEGQSWKTDATAGSQSMKFMADMTTAQGVEKGVGTWRLRHSINGGAYTDVFTINTGQNPAGGVSGPMILGANGGQSLTLQSNQLSFNAQGGSSGMIFTSNGGSYLLAGGTLATPVNNTGWQFTSTIAVASGVTNHNHIDCPTTVNSTSTGALTIFAPRVTFTDWDGLVIGYDWNPTTPGNIAGAHLAARFATGAVLLGGTTKGANTGDKVFIIENAGTNATAAQTNGIVIHAKDSSAGSANSTLALYLEQAVEAIGTFTPSHKIRWWINNIEYWIQLDAV